MRTHLAAFIFCLLSACGGGGSGTPVPLAATPMSGDYWMVLLNRENETPLDAAAFFGATSVADHMTTASVGTRVSDDGTKPETVPELTLGHDPSGRLTLGQSAGAFAYGTARSDGEMALLAMDVSGNAPGLALFTRRGGTHTVADLSGQYYLGNASMQLGNKAEYRTGTATFDGAGGVDFSVLTISDGTGGSATISGTYTVAPNGRVTISNAGGEVVAGLSADRTVLAGIGDTTTVPANGAPALWVFVRSDGGQPHANFAGKYTMAGALDSFDPGMEFLPIAGTFTASTDATGAGTATIEYFHNGLAPGIPASGSQSDVTYRTDASSAIECIVPTVAAIFGARTADGRFGFLCGGISTGDHSALLLLLRP